MRREVAHCPVCGDDQAVPVRATLPDPMVRCRACGLLYREPRPPAESFASGPADAGARIGLEERVGARRSWHFHRFLRAAGPPGRLLDVGCGYGFFLRLAREAGWEVTGVDMDPMAVAYARDRLGVTARLGDLRELRVPPGSFDLVTLWNALDFVPDPLELLREVHRVLKGGGQIFIRTPNATWQLLSFRLAGLLNRLGWGAAFDQRLTFVFHLTSFSRSTLRLLLERAGFVPLSIGNSRPIQGDPYLGLGPGGELLVSLAKLAVHRLAQGVSLLSGGHWLVGPSLEAYARRGEEQGR